MTRISRSGRRLFLNFQRAGQRDIAVEMALVKLVEDHRLDAATAQDPEAVAAAECLRSRT